MRDVRATIAAQLVAARGPGERGTRTVHEATGISRDKLRRIEIGEQPPSVADARALCSVYDVSPSTLPIMAHKPSKADIAWARQHVETLTVEQVVALAWAYPLPAAVVSAYLDGKDA